MKKKVSRFASFLFLFLAGSYIYWACELYLHQEKYVYYPSKIWKKTPAADGLAYEDLKLHSSDGVELSAWYIPRENPKGSVLFLHGNGRNMSGELDAVRMFHDFSYNVLTLDYRGYGKSGGVPDEEGTYRDAQAVWDFLVRDKKESSARIVVYGRSLGAAIATNLVSKNNKPQALILEAAFTSLPDAGQDIYPIFPVKYFSKYHYDTIDKLKLIHCPVLIVHSRDDQLVPFRHAKSLYEVVTGKKELIEIGGPHKGNYQPTLQKYKDGVKRFLDSL
jgi:hypothetical protein